MYISANSAWKIIIIIKTITLLFNFYIITTRA